jgi:hypothetical protein
VVPAAQSQIAVSGCSSGLPSGVRSYSTWPRALALSARRSITRSGAADCAGRRVDSGRQEPRPADLQVVALAAVGNEAQRGVIRREGLHRSIGELEEVSAHGVVAVVAFEPVADHREHVEAGIVRVDHGDGHGPVHGHESVQGDTLERPATRSRVALERSTCPPWPAARTRAQRLIGV